MRRISANSLCGSLCMAFSLQGLSLELQVVDNNGQQVTDAVVVFHLSEPDRQDYQRRFDAKHHPNTQPALMDQINREFVPFVLPIQKHQWVLFPNNDTVRHHVYSFSKPKRFEIKLYAGVPSEPVQFDKTGIVVLGCNIHDAMLAYIYITESPAFTRTNDQGVASLAMEGITPESVTVWHPFLGFDNAGVNHAWQAISESKSLTVPIN